jgi:Holliday junction resolvase
MKESKYVQEIIDLIERDSLSKCLKVHGNANVPKGTPDIIASVFGRTFVIECKVKDNKPSEKQLYELNQWAEGGAIAIWVSEKDFMPEEVKSLVFWLRDQKELQDTSRYYKLDQFMQKVNLYQQMYTRGY